MKAININDSFCTLVFLIVELKINRREFTDIDLFCRYQSPRFIVFLDLDCTRVIHIQNYKLLHVLDFNSFNDDEYARIANLHLLNTTPYFTRNHSNN